MRPELCKCFIRSMTACIIWRQRISTSFRKTTLCSFPSLLILLPVNLWTRGSQAELLSCQSVSPFSGLISRSFAYIIRWKTTRYAFLYHKTEVIFYHVVYCKLLILTFFFSERERETVFELSFVIKSEKGWSAFDSFCSWRLLLLVLSSTRPAVKTRRLIEVS